MASIAEEHQADVNSRCYKRSWVFSTSRSKVGLISRVEGLVADRGIRLIQG